MARRVIITILSVNLTLLYGASMAFGQDFPNKPIRIVTSEAGGGNDFTARLIAQGLTASWGQQVVVDNRPSGVIPGYTVSKATPDGYTLLVSSGILWLIPFLQNNVPFDPVKDFLPITLTNVAPNILVVHPTLAETSVKELIDYAKSRPGELNYASAGSGSSAHLSAELFKAMAGVNIVRISYKGTGPALNDLIGGHVQLAFFPVAAVVAHVKSGRLKALAVTSAEPSALFPGLPTVAATVPGYESVTITGIFAPAKTPVVRINQLNQEIVRFLTKTDTKERFLAVGVEPVGSSPQELAARIKSEMAKMGKVIKDAGIRAD